MSIAYKKEYSRDVVYILMLAVLSGFLYFFHLGHMALTDPDETFYAETAREMHNGGEWITPEIFGHPQFEKPILFYWAVILSYKVFGISEFAARFPSALMGIIGVIGMYLMGRSMFSRRTGFFSALILATSVQYIVLSKACVTDMTLTVFMLYCMLFIALAVNKCNRNLYVPAAVMAGLAVLTKGPIGLLIPGVVYLIYLIASKNIREITRIPFVPAIILFFLVAAPWYVAETKIHGSTFINEFFGFQNITRFLKPEHKIGSSPFFYIPVVLGGFFPWSFYLPAGVLTAIREKGTKAGKYGVFAVIWISVVFVFFTVSRTKLVTYIFPLFPGLALLAGRAWDIFAERETASVNIGKLMKGAYYVFFISSVAGIIGTYVFVRMKYPGASGGVALTLFFFLLGIIFSCVAFKKGRKILSFHAIVATVMIILLPIDAFVFPVIGKYESRRELVGILETLAKKGEAIGGESDYRRGIAYYAEDADIKEIHGFAQMRKFFMRKDRVWGIIKRKHYEELIGKEKGIVPPPLAQVGKMVLVTNKSLPPGRISNG